MDNNVSRKPGSAGDDERANISARCCWPCRTGPDPQVAPYQGHRSREPLPNKLSQRAAEKAKDLPAKREASRAGRLTTPSPALDPGKPRPMMHSSCECEKQQSGMLFPSLRTVADVLNGISACDRNLLQSVAKQLCEWDLPQASQASGIWRSAASIIPAARTVKEAGTSG